MDNLVEFFRNSETDPWFKDCRILYDDMIDQITPELVAELFACMDDTQQAKFFNHIHRVATQWHGGVGGLPIQLQYLTDTDTLTLEGRGVMSYIGDYSHWGLRRREGK